VPSEYLAVRRYVGKAVAYYIIMYHFVELTLMTQSTGRGRLSNQLFLLVQQNCPN
jgi:hypothetical protein